MINTNTKRVILAAMFTALTAVSTIVVQVPSPTGGYLNAGDTMVVLGAFILGPFWGAAAAGIGSALADLISGHLIYLPATLIIKALMALFAGLILRKGGQKRPLPYIILGSAVAELIMIAGYFAFTAIVLNFGWGAVVEIPGNCVQGIFGAVAGCVLFISLDRFTDSANNF